MIDRVSWRICLGSGFAVPQGIVYLRDKINVSVLSLDSDLSRNMSAASASNPVHC